MTAGTRSDGHGYVAARIDPRSMSVTVLAEGSGNPHYGGVSAALPVEHHLWVGSVHSDRLAYRNM